MQLHEISKLNYVQWVSPDTLARFISKDYLHMVGDVTRLFWVPDNDIRWQERPVHRMQFHGIADAIQKTLLIGVSTVTT